MPRARVTFREQPLVQEKLPSLPEGPGCYFFKDKNAKVISVVKAKNLRKRVRYSFARSAGRGVK